MRFKALKGWTEGVGLKGQLEVEGPRKGRVAGSNLALHS